MLCTVSGFVNQKSAVSLAPKSGPVSGHDTRYMDTQCADLGDGGRASNLGMYICVTGKCVTYVYMCDRQVCDVCIYV